MTDDPIVDEIHRVRARMLADCDGDLDKLMDRLREREAGDVGRVVRGVEELVALEQRRPATSS